MGLALQEMVVSRYKEIWAADVRIRRAFRGRQAMEILSSSAVDGASECGTVQHTVNERTG